MFGHDLPIYTPYIERPVTIEKNPSAIVRMAPLIQRIEAWAYEYEQKHRYECPGGVIVPRVNIGAIRGGVPYKITKTVQQCAIYVDVRITPVQNPLDIPRTCAGSWPVGLDARSSCSSTGPPSKRSKKSRAGGATRVTIGSARRRSPAVVAPFPACSRHQLLQRVRIPAITYGRARVARQLRSDSTLVTAPGSTR